MNEQDKEFREIEEKLKQLPIITDERSKEDVYAQVMAKMADDNKKRQASWYIPVVASSVAILLLFILLPKMMNDSNDVAIHESQPIAESNEFNEEATIFAEEDSLFEERMNYIYAAKESDLLQESIIVTIPYMDPSNTFVVPISFTILNNEALLEQVEEIVTNFDPKFIGLANTLLQGVSLRENNKSELVVTILTKELLEQEAKLLFQSIEMLAKSLHYERVMIEEDGNASVLQGGFENGSEIRYGYYLYETDTSHLLLVPRQLDSVTFFETLEKMKEVNSEYYQPVIPREVTLQIEEHGDLVKVIFSEQNRLDESMIEPVIEALLLVAREFAFEYVEIHGLSTKQNSIYNLNEKLSTKLAPNGM